MKGFDAFAGVIKSGGKTRRAAKMVIINIDHPDIIEFINAKAHEEKKAWALIEAGYDPHTVSEKLFAQIEKLLVSSIKLYDICMQEMPDESDEEIDPYEKFSEIEAQKLEEFPTEANAWRSLTELELPMVSIMSADPSIRATAKRLQESYEHLLPYHPGAHWPACLMSVLEKEPILVIEPESKLGIKGEISGIADNFQLHVLLMARFPHTDRYESRISSESLAVASGEGPQKGGETITGTWNLYSYKVLNKKPLLPDLDDYESNKHWAWGEGKPMDIPVFSGYRVILLGPPSYHRIISSQRYFSALPADIYNIKNLSKTEVDSWLEKILESNQE